MPLAAPLANLSVYYATCLPRLKTEWTDTTAAEYLPERISNKIKKSSEALVGEKKNQKLLKSVFKDNQESNYTQACILVCRQAPTQNQTPGNISTRLSLL